MLRDDKMEFLTKETPEDEIARAIDCSKRHPLHRKRLLDYLPQQHPVYQGRSANEAIRIRGYLFESFAHTGLSDSALPFVLETLETGRDAYLVAGAAISLRGLSAPRPEIVPYLLKAASNMRFTDDAISFESYKPRWPLRNPSTALLEIFRTIQWMGACAREFETPLKELCGDVYFSDSVRSEIRKTIAVIEHGNRPGCCQWSVSRSIKRGDFQTRKKLTEDVAELLLEDQDGRTITFREYFVGRPSAVVFFYTRCDNPNKCSLTITRLGQLQKALVTAGLDGTIRIAAITYDPAYDRPFRLESYCRSRGMLLNEQNRAFGTLTGMPVVLRYFDPGVNYIGSIVNQHTTELYVLDQRGNIASRFQQLQWHVPEVIGQLKKHLRKNQRGNGIVPNSARIKARDWMSSLLSLLIVFFPKCPLCCAAYLSALGITNIQILHLVSQLLPVLVGLLFINLLSLFKGANRRNGLLPLYLSSTGIFCSMFFGLLMKVTVMGYIGASLMLAGSLLNSLDRHAFKWIRVSITGLAGGLKFRIAEQFGIMKRICMFFRGSEKTQRLSLLLEEDQESVN